MITELQTLLNTYSLSDIFLFTVLLVSIIIGGIRLSDEVGRFMKRFFDRASAKNKKEELVQKRFKELEERQLTSEKVASETTESLKAFTEKLAILVDSDKDSIKAYLTDKHHYYYYTQKWVDDYNLDCIERRYVHYKKAGGNSFVDHLMEELRSLPTQPPAKEE